MRNPSRRALVALAALGAAAAAGGRLAAPALAGGGVMEVYKSPWCGCCGAWVEHMRAAGFDVRVTEVEELDPVKARYGVAPDLQSCHTAVIDGYVVEGHVPAREVARLLQERPAATGLAVPGMPVGSPGMEQGARKDPYPVILFSPTKMSLWARY